MELHIVGGPTRGHHNLGADRAGGNADRSGGVMDGDWPWGTTNERITDSKRR
jgi:hypothetical protein